MTTRDRVAELLRWEEAGAHWQVVSRGWAHEPEGTAEMSAVTIALLRCDGGEEVDRFTSTDPALLRFVAARDEAPD